MTPTAARIWLIKASLAAYGACFVFFVLAPALGYPLDYSEAIDVLKVIVPVFAGYLGAAVAFLVGKPRPEAAEVQDQMLSWLVRGPLAVFAVGMIALLIGFPLSNRGEFNGAGMTPD